VLQVGKRKSFGWFRVIFLFFLFLSCQKQNAHVTQCSTHIQGALHGVSMEMDAVPS
jgi:hypothetical protein